MIKYTLSLLTALGLLCVSASGQTTAPVSLYNANELSIGLGTGYQVQGGFSDNYTFNLTAQASYYPFKYLGIATELPFYTGDGVSVREVGLSLIGRVPVYKGLAFQTSLGSYYAWEAKEFNYFVEPALQYRFNPKWGVTVGGQYRIADFKDFSYDQGQWSLRTFVTLNF